MDEWNQSKYDAPIKPYAVNKLMVADDAKREYGVKDGEQGILLEVLEEKVMAPVNFKWHGNSW